MKNKISSLLTNNNSQILEFNILEWAPFSMVIILIILFDRHRIRSSIFAIFFARHTRIAKNKWFVSGYCTFLYMWASRTDFVRKTKKKQWHSTTNLNFARSQSNYMFISVEFFWQQTADAQLKKWRCFPRFSRQIESFCFLPVVSLNVVEYRLFNLTEDETYKLFRGQ